VPKACHSVAYAWHTAVRVPVGQGCRPTLPSHNWHVELVRLVTRIIAGFKQVIYNVNAC